MLRERIDRRRFDGRLIGATVTGFMASILYPVVRYPTPPEAAESATTSVSLDIDPASVQPNSGRIFRFGKFLKSAPPGGELRAFTAICTHLACTVQYRPDLQHIWCACHNGHFNLRGVNVAGPPPRPLETYEVRTRNGQVGVSKRS